MINTKEVNPQNLRPRNKHVILYRELASGNKDNGRTKLVMPQNAAEAWKWTVVAIAPDVEDLRLGDSVWVTGKLGVNYAPVPGSTNLFIIDEQNVLLVVGVECQNQETVPQVQESDR
jgi:hypothetical protein